MRKERREEEKSHLWDRPVPPVKGNITNGQDICPRPEQRAKSQEQMDWNSLL